MREHKYRAWDKQERKFFIVNKLLFMFESVTGISADVIVNNELGKTIMPENLILVQYTGLKDRNGVDIYEGDVVRYPATDRWSRKNYACYETFYHDGAGASYNVGFYCGRTHYHGSVCGGYVPLFTFDTAKKLEVIGNIYENPELTPDCKSA